MKHPIIPTMKILAWLLGGILVMFAAIPAATKSTVDLPVSQGTFITLIMVMIGIGAAMWLFFIKNIDAKKLRIVMAIGLGVIGTRAVFTFAPWAANFVTTPLLIGVLAYAMYSIARVVGDEKSRKGKSFEWRYELISTLAVANNLFYAFVIPTVGVIYGLMIEPLYAALLLSAVALYDAWAVWKSKIMQKLATFLMKDIGAFPGYLVTYKQPKTKAKNSKDEIALGFLGGGDVFFLSLVPVSFMQFNFILGLATLFGMTIALVGLFLMSDKKPYPAIPFMWAGMLFGILWVAVFGASS